MVRLVALTVARLGAEGGTAFAISVNLILGMPHRRHLGKIILTAAVASFDTMTPGS